MYSKDNEYKNKISFRCVLHENDCSGTGYIEFGKFFDNQQHNQPEFFADIKKTNIEARKKNESDTSTFAPSDTSNKNINHENVDISTFTKISSIMMKRRANKFRPSKKEDFDKLLRQGSIHILKSKGSGNGLCSW